MDAAVMIPILLSLTSLGLWFHGIVSLIKFIVEIKLYNKDKTDKGNGVILNLTDNQFDLVSESLELWHEADLEKIGYFSSPEHFDKDELSAYLKESDDLFDLIHYLRSCISLEKGGEE